ncbi:hypothetical protein FRC07_011543, partial [Ceratobasidium sp. 392]
MKYIEGTTNILADALSRIYSEDPMGTERAKSEYVPEDRSDSEDTKIEVTRPILGGRAAQIVTDNDGQEAGIRRNPARDRQAPTRYDPEIPGRDPVSKKKKAKKVDKRPERSKENIASTLEVEAEGERVPPQDQNVVNATDPNDPTEPENITKLVTELDVIKAIRHKYGEDEYFSKIMENIEQFPDYEYKEGLLYMNEHERTYLCIPQ